MWNAFVQTLAFFASVCCSAAVWGGELVPFASGEVIAVWKSESDLEKASNIFGELTQDALDPYVECWVVSGTEAILLTPPASEGLAHVRVESGDSAGCSGIVLQQEYDPG